MEIGLNEFMSNPKALIVDVRTPAEYDLGHIAGAVNLPLFSNEERAEVGTIYKQVGRNEAVERGLEFVGPKMAGFVRSAKQMINNEISELNLYCWRGGMRSGSMAWLLSTAGLKVNYLKGGYKTYRREFDEILELPWWFVVVSGKTGCGKTDVLREMELLGEQVLDLEGLANHKGSAFGGMGLGVQPSTETFINLLHQKLREFSHERVVWCEGESMLIGHVYIPQELFTKITDAPSIDFEIGLEARINRLVKEYGAFDIEELKAIFCKIRKRLGNDNLKDALSALDNGDVAQAAKIALRYYDKGYAQSNSKRSGKLLCRFSTEEDTPELTARQLKEIYYNSNKI